MNHYTNMANKINAKITSCGLARSPAKTSRDANSRLITVSGFKASMFGSMVF